MRTPKASRLWPWWVGENEMNEGKVTLKNMETGEQKMVTPQELVSELK